MLTSTFLGEEYEAAWSTGAEPLYVVVPDKPLSKYKYSSDDPLSQFAEMVSADFHSYALPFYERYDSLDKLEAYFDQYPKRDTKEDGFSVVRSGRQGSGRGCCIAAVLCLQKRWDKLQMFLEDTELLLPEQKERINEYISHR